MPEQLEWITPDWPAPANVLALSTTRHGGESVAPYDSLNLGDHVGDNIAAVQANRRQLGGVLPDAAVISWLRQVHGTGIVEAAMGETPEADAQWSRIPGVACAILTADCLPVLFCNTGGDVVAAAHAGWRGLQAGVLETTVAAMNVDPGKLLAWLGPAIGPATFEVGGEVREAFMSAAGPGQWSATAACFLSRPGHTGKWYANLYALAWRRLHVLGITRVFGGSYCTHSDSQRFFSHRRDGKTGRMASLVLLR